MPDRGLTNANTSMLIQDVVAGEPAGRSDAVSIQGPVDIRLHAPKNSDVSKHPIMSDFVLNRDFPRYACRSERRMGPVMTVSGQGSFLTRMQVSKPRRAVEIGKIFSGEIFSSHPWKQAAF